MRPMEIVYGSLAEAREHGPQDVVQRVESEGLRLLSSPSYCERDGLGVCAFDVAGEPESATNDADDSPAASVAATNGDDQ